MANVHHLIFPSGHHKQMDGRVDQEGGHGAGDGGRHTVVGTKTNGGVPPVPGGQR